MPAAIPVDIRAMLSEPISFHAATVNRDGSPQVSVVWADLDGDLVRFSTARKGEPSLATYATTPESRFPSHRRTIRIATLSSTAVLLRLSHGEMDLIDHMARKYTRRRQLSVVAARRGAGRHRHRDRSNHRLAGSLYPWLGK